MDVFLSDMEKCNDLKLTSSCRVSSNVLLLAGGKFESESCTVFANRAKPEVIMGRSGDAHVNSNMLQHDAMKKMSYDVGCKEMDLRRSPHVHFFEILWTRGFRGSLLLPGESLDVDQLERLTISE